MAKKASLTLTVLLAAALITGCAPAREPVVATAPPLPTAITAPAIVLPQVEEEALIPADSFNRFGLTLFQAIRGDKNWAVAPVHTALALEQLRPGAQGDTAAQMDAVLGLDPQLETDVHWASMASLRRQLEAMAPVGLWQQWAVMIGEGPSVRVQYADLLQMGLDSRVELVDYSQPTVSEVYSGWVKQASGGLITELTALPAENTPATVCFAAALEGRWEKAFNPENIRNATFSLESGKKMNAAMMTAKLSCQILESDAVRFAAVAMDGSLEAWLMQPPEKVALKDFVRDLDLSRMRQWREQATTQLCLVTVPRIDVEWTGDLLNPLMGMGILAAADAQTADFGLMGSQLALGSVQGAVRLRLGEAGEKAADEAMSQRMLRGMDRDMRSYSFDRPFVLALYDTRTEAIMLLAGVVTPAPLEEEA